MRRKSGEAFYAHLSLSLLRDEDELPCGMIGYSLDITARKRGRGRASLWIREQVAHVEAEAARERQAFQAEVSARLSAVFDYQGRVRELASSMVPRLADWCAVDMLEGEDWVRHLSVVSD